MMDPAPDRPPATSGERWGYALFGLVLLGLLVGEVIRDYQPMKLSMVFITLAWFPLLVIHEAGHAVMARLLGWRVLEVVMGLGRPLARFRLGETRVELRALPLEGFCRPAPRSPHSSPRLKNFLIYAAGPGSELLVLGLITLLVGPGRMLTQSDQVAVIAAQSFGVAVLMGVAINLIPHTAETSHGRAVNDGLGMILSLVRPREHFEELARDLEQSDEEGS